MRKAFSCCCCPTAAAALIDEPEERSSHRRARPSTGAGDIPLAAQTVDDLAHPAVPRLRALDDRLAGALRKGVIKLLMSDFLRLEGGVGRLLRIERRQDLEALEAEQTGLKIFLTPEEAVSALRSNTRAIAALTYGWTSPDHPDVTNAYLHAVSKFLRHRSGAHLRAVFWE